MPERTRAQESRAAIERMYIVMRHLFQRGFYKPFGKSGEALRKALLTLSPEIYGSIADPAKVELNGLRYVMDRLPKGIEECRFIKLSSREGYGDSNFEVIVAPKRRRNCYRIDREEMVIEVTRGRSEIYDILTHLTFFYIEAEKIKNNVLGEDLKVIREWDKLEEIVMNKSGITDKNRDVAFTYLAAILGRTYSETEHAYNQFKVSRGNNGLFHVIYWMGKLAMVEATEEKDREISFTPTLRERIGHHIYGEIWASEIKRVLHRKGLMDRPIHIISSNLHSVLNTLYAYPALVKQWGPDSLETYADKLSERSQAKQMAQVESFAADHGLINIPDNSGTNLSVQLIDLQAISGLEKFKELQINLPSIEKNKPVLLVLDYPFGEQAFEIMDELLKPAELSSEPQYLHIESISVLGKAGTLMGKKGDIMIPTAHIFEGTADNYPIDNELTESDFADCDVSVFSGPMITVLGTSLQNKDILSYFKHSSWKVIGLEMEGAHLQKAIQAASKIRNSINRDVTLRYAYYASDNPLESGSTLASGSLGKIGVKPTYLITRIMLNKILQ